MFSSLLCFLLAQDAFAIPLQMNHQGRLLDNDGNGLTGSHELIFRIMDDPEDGYALYTETQTVNFINGYYSVLLGADEENNPLDDSVFANYPLYLALKVDGENLEPRQPMTSVPYAQIAGVAESVDGGTVNASEVNVGGQAVINADGQWVGEAPTVDFMNLQNRPQGLDDGDDNTQLDQTEVVDYVNGSQVNLGAASQVDGSNIVTAGDFDTYLPTDLADGDNDLLASISCAVGELISWDGQNWACVSDNTLELTDIETMVLNNPMDLNAATTIGGLNIVTSMDDSDTLASLSCQNDGEIARYDLVLDEWYCSTDIYTDTVLDQAGVLAYVNGEALSLATGTQVNGSDVVTVDTFASNLPSDLADGDADTQLDQAGVLGFVDGQTINLGTGSQVNNSNIVTAGDFDTYLPTDLADGDNDTLASLSCAQGELAAWDGNSSWVCVSDNTLDESTVEGYITNGTINLAQGSQVDGNAILTSIDQLDWNKLDNIPGDLADGDNDTVGSLSCADGEYPAFDANAGSWVCVGNAGSGGVVVGTYVGDGNSSQTISLPQTIDTLKISSPQLGFEILANTQMPTNLFNRFTPASIYGSETDGNLTVNSNSTITGTDFEYSSVNISSGTVLTIDSGINEQGTIIRATSDIEILGDVNVTPRGTYQSVSNNTGGGAGCHGGGGSGPNGPSSSELYSYNDFNSLSPLLGETGGTGSGCAPGSTNGASGGSGGTGGGGLTIISSTKIVVGASANINISGDLGNSGTQCCSFSWSGPNGSGGNGSGGVLKLIAPYIEIEGTIISSNGALIIIGYATTTNSSLPTTTEFYPSLSTYLSSPMPIQNVSITQSDFVVQNLFNLQGETYYYTVH